MVGKTFNVGISGAIEAPLYIHGVTDLKLWQTRIRKLPAPYAELVSERMIITLPSEYIRDLDRPDQVMDLWNQMVEKCAELACIDINEYRAARITFERQIANGGLHSGYPIGAHIGKNAEEAVDVESLRKTGNWGFLHEFGHNHQHRPWLLPNTTETTCNLWSVYVSEELFGVSRNDAHREGNRKAREDRMVDYFKRGAPFKEEWAGWTALESYLQIQESFGWEVYKKVFTEYNAYPQGKGPKVDQARYDEWVRKMSRACGVNLVPFYQTWGMPISPSVAGELQTLPEWKQDPVARFRGLNEVRTSL